jgi:hypothetical protein
MEDIIMNFSVKDNNYKDDPCLVVRVIKYSYKGFYTEKEAKKAHLKSLNRPNTADFGYLDSRSVTFYSDNGYLEIRRVSDEDFLCFEINDTKQRYYRDPKGYVNNPLTLYEDKNVWGIGIPIEDIETRKLWKADEKHLRKIRIRNDREKEKKRSFFEKVDPLVDIELQFENMMDSYEIKKIDDMVLCVLISFLDTPTRLKEQEEGLEMNNSEKLVDVYRNGVFYKKKKKEDFESDDYILDRNGWLKSAKK